MKAAGQQTLRLGGTARQSKRLEIGLSRSNMKCILLFIAAAVFAVVTPAVVPAEDNSVDNAVPTTVLPVDVTAVSNNDGVDGPDVFDENSQIDGIPIKYLRKDEIYIILEEDDNLVMSELDWLVTKKVVKGRQELYGGQGRQKRWVPLAIRLAQAGRALFSASRAGRVTTSGARTTRQYARPGNYNDAVRDFNRFQPDGVRPITGSKGISGQTGTVGNHRITVRNGSSNGSPTLEIRSPKSGGEFVRKFRYEK